METAVVNAASKCGECANCKKGKPACLSDPGTMFRRWGPNGAQAEYIRLPKGAYMNPIPDDQTEENIDSRYAVHRVLQPR